MSLSSGVIDGTRSLRCHTPIFSWHTFLVALFGIWWSKGSFQYPTRNLIESLELAKLVVKILISLLKFENVSYCIDDKEYLQIIVTPYECHGVSNYMRLDCLCKDFFRLTTARPLCERSRRRLVSSQRASNGESVPMVWHHHGTSCIIMAPRSTHATQTSFLITVFSVVTWQELECPVVNIDYYHDFIVRLVFAKQYLMRSASKARL